MPSTALVRTGSTGLNPTSAIRYLGGIAGSAVLTNTSTASLSNHSPLFTAGVLSNMSVCVSANTANATFTFRPRRSSGVVGAQSVAVPPLTTGVFEDITNTDDVTPSGTPAVDLWGYQSTWTGTGAATVCTVTAIAVLFTRSGNETPLAMMQATTGGLGSGGSLFHSPIVGRSNTNAVLANNQLPIYDDGTCRNAFVYVVTNSRASASTITLYNNGVATALVINVPAGATGFFYNTTDTVAVDEDDLLTWGTNLVSGTFAGNQIGFEFVSDSDAIYRAGIGSGTGGNINVVNSTVYLHAGGSLSHDAVAVERQSLAGQDFVADGLAVQISSSTINSTSISFTLQIHGVDTALVLTIPAGVSTGWHSVALDVPVLATDLVGIKYIASATPPSTASVILTGFGNASPIVDAGPDQAITLPATSAILAGSAIDTDPVTYLWTQISGPALVTFADPTDPGTAVTFIPAIGTYVLQLAASDGALTGTDTMTITLQEALDADDCPSGPWGVSINGIDRTGMFKLDQVDIQYTLGSPGRLGCVMIDKGPPAVAVRPSIGNVIIVTKGVRVFTGKIVAADETSLVSPNIGTGTLIASVDYQRALARRRFTKNYDPYAYVLVHPPGNATVVLRSNGANNDLLFTTREAWSGANNYQIEMVDPGAASQPLTVVHDPAVNTSIFLETDSGGAIVTTAADIAAIPEFVSPGLLWAELTPEDPAGSANTGAGIVAPIGLTNFAGGFERTYETIRERVSNYSIAGSGPTAGLTIVGTVYPHGLVTGDRVTFTGVEETTPTINDLQFEVTVTTPSEFTIVHALTASGAGGKVVKLVQVNTIFDDLLPFLATYGITTNIEANGPWIVAPQFILETLEGVINYATKLAGWVYRMTPYKVLQAFTPGTVVAPFELSIANANFVGPVPQARTRERYINALHVTGGRSGEMVTRRSSWIGDGTTKAFPLEDPNSWQLANNGTHPGSIIIDGTSGPLTELYPGSASFEWQFDIANKVIHQDPAFTAPPSGTIIEFTYQGPANFTVYVPDDVAIAANDGEIEEDAFDVGEDATISTAIALGKVEIARRSAIERMANVVTFECLVLPGTVIPVDNADRLMADEWLAVTSRMQSMNALRNGELLAKYSYSLLEEGLPTTWVDFWKRR